MIRPAIAIGILLIVSGTGCAGGGAPKPRITKEVPPPQRPPQVPQERDQALDPALRAAATAQIQLACNSNDPRLRANGIEAAQNVLGAQSHALVAQGLRDRDAIVRFAATMAAGTLRFRDMHPTLLALAKDPSEKVQIGARFALHRIGDTTLSHDLEKYAVDTRPRVRIDTAFVLGLLEEPSARKILRDMMMDLDSDVRLQVAESLWRLKDEQALDVLVAGSVSNFVDDQMICLMALAGPKDSRVEGYVRGKLTDPYAEVALVAARAMGDLGKDEGYGVALKGIKNADARQRYLGALALGAIGRADAQPILSPLLRDSDQNVRIAAAKAILQLKAA